MAQALDVDRSRVTRWLKDEDPDPDNLIKLEIRRVRTHPTAPVLPPRDGAEVAVRVQRHLGDAPPDRPAGAGPGRTWRGVIRAVEADETGAYA